MDETPRFASLAAAALAVLTAADPAEKVRLTRAAVQVWAMGTLSVGSVSSIPDRPARPDQPTLVSPSAMPHRRLTRGVRGRVTLLHALAHIELNAVDLAWDIVARFAPQFPPAFAADWLTVAADEAEHFALLAARLADLGAAYGDLPAHDGLWQSAQETAGDALARLAVIPMVHEARGLDVTPMMIEKLRAVEDETSAQVLERIYRDEIGHVALGNRWFLWLAAARGLDDPRRAWQTLIRQHFRGALKPPFNDEARATAGFPGDWYAPLALSGDALAHVP
ncbi:ferritin-like domain-containing protein [Elstera sp.]|jgi:uncharacterized ferritin-like protein (DUF455 family)|uniref:ferritin-like domain-containing protein n=1 Tax=Elstera sp. TaxID=1916664 RepID=UPI0037C10B12